MRNEKGQFIKGSGFWTGKKRSEETKIKLRKSLKGRKLSDATRKKMSETRKRLGIVPPSPRGRIISEETRKKMSKAQLGKKGKPLTIEQKKHLSEFHKGEKSHLWRGGITPQIRAIRNSLEYKLWRKAVFERDNWACVWCNERGGKLNADHIKSFRDYPELRFAIDNGRTLCEACHRTTDTYGARAKTKQHEKNR
jgi:hypothetical protein